MAVPKNRTTRSRKGHRRSHHAIQLPSIIRCSRCNTAIERHTICPECGHYRGKPVIAVEEAQA